MMINITALVGYRSGPSSLLQIFVNKSETSELRNNLINRRLDDFSELVPLLDEI